MPGIVDLVSFISDDVIARLDAAGYPPLVDGQILLGRQHLLEQSAPPRIVFVPVRSVFGARDTYNRSRVASSPSTEQRLQYAQRALHSEVVTFEVHVWGAAEPPDPDDDFDATQALYHVVIQSLRANITGGYELGDGDWTDQHPDAAQLQKLGHEFVFEVSIGTPVLDELHPLVPISSVETTVEFSGNSATGETVIVVVP